MFIAVRGVLVDGGGAAAAFLVVWRSNVEVRCAAKDHTGIEMGGGGGILLVGMELTVSVSASISSEREEEEEEEEVKEDSSST
jgi:hypothetical protein